jgi:hypothetical protein
MDTKKHGWVIRVMEVSGESLKVATKGSIREYSEDHEFLGHQSSQQWFAQ